MSGDFGQGTFSINDLHSFNSFHSGLTIRSVRDSTSYQSYQDFGDAILAPPAAVTTHSTKTPSGPTGSDHSRPSNHRRANTEIIPQHSLSCPLTSARSSALEELYKPQQNLERPTKRKLGAGGKFLADWFQGTSDPVTLGVFLSPKDHSSMISATDATMTNSQADDISSVPSQSKTNILQKRMTAPSALRQVASSTRSLWLGSKSQEPAQPALPEPADDEFLNLDITAALFPSGSSKEYSPDAFAALQANAENTLRRLQAAYKQRTFALHEVLAQKTEQQEELADSRTRVQNVKTQLDGMAGKVSEQQRTIETLADELEKERQARREAEDARGRTELPARCFNDMLETPRHAKRFSSSTVTSDSGFDSGEESQAESIFSRRVEYSASPLSSRSTASCATSPEITSSPAFAAASQSNLKTSSPTPKNPPRLSAYDRVIKGLSNTLGGSANTPSECSNCHGVLASEAWSVVGILRDENKGLKTRIGDLESVIDDCLGVVGSPNI
jgi:hypothetical protein